jgi:hypothetical protein
MGRRQSPSSQATPSLSVMSAGPNSFLMTYAGNLCDPAKLQSIQINKNALHGYVDLNPERLPSCHSLSIASTGSRIAAV